MSENTYSTSYDGKTDANNLNPNKGRKDGFLKRLFHHRPVSQSIELGGAAAFV
jgi:hypothetical protein